MPGKTRLAKRLLHSTVESGNASVTSRDGFRFVVPSLREPIGFYLLVDGIYEIASIKFILKYLKPGATFIDVGANVGAFTLPAARKVGRSGRVIAVEASSLIYPYLRQNVASSGMANIRLLECAAFNQDDLRMPFYEAPKDHFGMGSLGEQFNAEPSLVNTRRLDSILAEEKVTQVDLIKVDVEGFEAAVFEGAENLLSDNRAPMILFEFCDWAEARVPNGEVGAAQQLLKDFGYSLWRLRDFLKGVLPLRNVLREGSEMLVAAKF